MFVRRSRYDAVVRESQGLLDENSALQSQLGKSLTNNEKKDEVIAKLFADAKIHAKALSKKADELKEAKKDIQRFEQLKKDVHELNFDLTEYMNPEPVDAEQRALYVARVAGYFNGGLKDYINHLMSTFKAEISRFPLTERETDFFRSGVNLCHLLVEWGDGLINEHHANAREEVGTDTEDAFDATPEEDEAVENIKSSVNKE